MNEPVKVGDKVVIHYKGEFDDGTIFDSTTDKGPLVFVVGRGETIAGFDVSVVGMKKGEEKKLRLPPIIPQLPSQTVHTVAKEKIPKKLCKIDGVILLTTLDGKEYPAKITALSESHATVDLDHSFAGKHLNFTINLVDIRKNMFRRFWDKLGK